jgi:hypothetical protein
MRELVAGLFITLDGVTEAPDKWPVPERQRPEAAEAGRFQDDRYRRAHRHLPPAEERLR